MIITIIGSTAYLDKMIKHRGELEKEGHCVLLPALDNFQGMNELEVCTYNRIQIEKANEVHVIWDGRSIGTIFDLGMCFALKKKIVLVYINNKLFTNFVEQYATL